MDAAFLNNGVNFSTRVLAGFKRLSASTKARRNWKAQVSVPVLIEALKDESEQVRWHAVWVLSKIGSEAKAAVPALIEALNDEEEEIHRLAAKTLLKLGYSV
jgi:HEAT repeat protein